MTIDAVYQKGVFIPREPLDLSEPTWVKLQVILVEPDEKKGGWEKELARLQARTPEEIMAARERMEKTSRPPRPLPPGMTLEDVVKGMWPGDETDEEVNAALERLS